MTIIFLTTDPRGFKVECYEGRLNYIFEVKHPELDNEGITIEDIKYAIEKPKDFIYVATEGAHKGSHIYYKRMLKKTYDLKVVVKFDGGEYGVIEDIYPCSRRSPKEKIIWPKLSNC